MNNNYIIINGIRSTEIKGLLISTLPHISKPLLRTEQVVIDGRDGDIINPLGYSAYDKTMTIGLWGDYDIDQVISFLATEGTIIFSNEPDKYYRFTMIDRIDFEKLLKWKNATLTLHVQPYKYSAVEEEYVIEQEFGTISDQEFFVEDARASVCEDFIITIPQKNSPYTELIIFHETDHTDGYRYDLKEYDGSLPLYTFYGGTLNVKTGLLKSMWDANGVRKTVPELRTLDTHTILLADGYNRFSNVATDQWAGQYNCEMMLTYKKRMTPVITNHGNAKAKPIITIEGDGLVYLFVAGRYALTAAVEESITIDTEEMEAYRGKLLLNRYVSGDYEDIWLTPGRNLIAWSGNVTRISFKNYSRWI